MFYIRDRRKINVKPHAHACISTQVLHERKRKSRLLVRTTRVVRIVMQGGRLGRSISLTL